MLGHLKSNPLIVGALIGLALGGPHFFLMANISVLLSALTLTLIAGIYLGFAIVRDSEKVFGVELCASIGFTTIAFLGLVVDPLIIIVGLVGHSLWDLAHHNQRLGLMKIPQWYIPFCIIVDLVLAGVLYYVW